MILKRYKDDGIIFERKAEKQNHMPDKDKKIEENGSSN
jgi:hypothetical protein